MGHGSGVVNTINSSNRTVMNAAYLTYNVAKIPFKFNKSDKIDDSIIDILKDSSLNQILIFRII